MDIFDEEFVNLVLALQENQVKYIFVGDVATTLNGFSTLTPEIDIWIKDDSENHTKLKKALGWKEIPGNYFTNGMNLAIVNQLVGLENYGFDECYKLSPIAEIHDIEIKFLHINFLIENKKKVNRDKDKIDVTNLERIKKESENNSEKK